MTVHKAATSTQTSTATSTQTSTATSTQESAVRQEGNEDISEFEAGEFDPKLLPSVLQSIDKLFGMWDLIKERSDSTDSLMKAIGIGMLKRMAVNNSTTSVELKPITTVNGRRSIFMTSFLPMNNKKRRRRLH